MQLDFCLFVFQRKSVFLMSRISPVLSKIGEFGDDLRSLPFCTEKMFYPFVKRDLGFVARIKSWSCFKQLRLGVVVSFFGGDLGWAGRDLGCQELGAQHKWNHRIDLGGQELMQNSPGGICGVRNRGSEQS